MGAGAIGAYFGSRLGRETGRPTPWTNAAYAILKPWAIRNEAHS